MPTLCRVVRLPGVDGCSSLYSGLCWRDLLAREIHHASVAPFALAIGAACTATPELLISFPSTSTIVAMDRSRPKQNERPIGCAHRISPPNPKRLRTPRFMAHQAMAGLRPCAKSKLDD